MEQINSLLRASVEGIQLVDVCRHFVEPDGTINTSKMHDYLHLTADGYRILQEQLVPLMDAAFSQ